MASHGSLTDNHVPYNWTYADAAARTGATGLVAADDGKLALQVDTDDIYMLTDYSGPTWKLLGGIADVVEDTTPQLGGTLDANSNDVDNAKSITFIAEVDNGSSSTADTIDWGAGQKQKTTMTGACTYTFTDPLGPCNLILKVIQGGTGNYVATWPASVKWPGGTAPTLSTAVAAEDLISFYFDGTNYYGNSSLDFS